MKNDTNITVTFGHRFEKSGDHMVILSAGDRQLMTVHYNPDHGRMSLTIDKEVGSFNAVRLYDSFQTMDFTLTEWFPNDLFDDDKECE